MEIEITEQQIKIISDNSCVTINRSRFNNMDFATIYPILQSCKKGISLENFSCQMCYISGKIFSSRMSYKDGEFEFHEEQNGRVTQKNVEPSQLVKLLTEFQKWIYALHPELKLPDRPVILREKCWNEHPLIFGGAREDFPYGYTTNILASPVIFRSIENFGDHFLHCDQYKIVQVPSCFFSNKGYPLFKIKNKNRYDKIHINPAELLWNFIDEHSVIDIKNYKKFYSYINIEDFTSITKKVVLNEQSLWKSVKYQDLTLFRKSYDQLTLTELKHRELINYLVESIQKLPELKDSTSDSSADYYKICDKNLLIMLETIINDSRSTEIIDFPFMWFQELIKVNNQN